MCFSETKTDDLDNIELDGYDFKMKNRGTFLHRKSGRSSLLKSLIDLI